MSRYGPSLFTVPRHLLNHSHLCLHPPPTRFNAPSFASSHPHPLQHPLSCRPYLAPTLPPSFPPSTSSTPLLSSFVYPLSSYVTSNAFHPLLSHLAFHALLHPLLHASLSSAMHLYILHPLSSPLFPAINSPTLHVSFSFSNCLSLNAFLLYLLLHTLTSNRNYS